MEISRRNILSSFIGTFFIRFNPQAGMSFSLALEYLKKGYHLARIGWEGQYYYIIDNELFLWNNGGKIYIPVVSVENLLADDWTIIIK